MHFVMGKETGEGLQDQVGEEILCGMCASDRFFVGLVLIQVPVYLVPLTVSRKGAS